MSTTGVVLVGISIVFICMVIITLILSAFPVLLGSGKKKKSEPEEEPESLQPVVVPTESVVQVSENSNREDGQLIAVITAAVAAYLGDSSGNRFRVVSFKRVGDNAPVWARTGRLENLTE